MGDLAWVKKRFPQNLVIKFFPGIQRCKIFFSSFIRLERYFFHCRNFLRRYFLARIFSLENKSAGHFFF